MSWHNAPRLARVDRRHALLATTALLAATALSRSGAAQAAHDDQPQPAPSPIKAILPIPGTDFHIQAPGPPTLKLPFSGAIPQGLNFDPSAITDFKGFSALAYPAGAARGSDGITYNLEGDMRFFTGKYKPAIGQVREGTFCFV